ncbi:helix-turn-helix transcriptional regulator [Streptomyces sp. NPDC046215]|uniref:HTH luxR-type domain-containing protein n=1 Tax=Streptomyces stramineus TaxID=173861 RepID=A0ABN1AMV4_9ACTN
MLSAIGLDAAIGPDAVREPVPCRREAPRTAGHSAVELVTGTAAVTERLRRLRFGASGEVCALLAGSPWPALADGVSAVPHRAVVERSARTSAGAPDRGTAARIRVADRVPAELVVADRAVALLALTPRPSGPAEPTALLVHPGGLLTSLVTLFEDIWSGAVPLRGRPDGTPEGPAAGPDAMDLRVLSLLMAGLTDASVAKQLGLGLRTVQRRVKRLMELAGVTTRLQLGRHAAESGWLPPG